MKKQSKKLTLRKATIAVLKPVEQQKVNAGKAATSRDPVSCKILCPYNL